MLTFVADWNSLPTDVVMADNINLFSARIVQKLLGVRAV